MQQSLLIGAGNSRQKKVQFGGNAEWSGKLVTLDMNPNCGADVIWNMEDRPLPFPDDSFDEMGAFDTLEHWGRQGDWRGFFEEFAEYWRILKPGGLFGIIVPINKDALADPGHTRFFHANYFGFLNQKFYEHNLSKGTCATDYRWFWKLNFDLLYMDDANGHHLAVVLQKA